MHISINKERDYAEDVEHSVKERRAQRTVRGRSEEEKDWWTAKMSQAQKFMCGCMDV